ncbi:MAG: Omp28-related outer membrane protein [Saprospiraceae bacterium]|nr:Omp28-related outer membrane protein [Saprospiraceae bacterium]
MRPVFFIIGCIVLLVACKEDRVIEPVVPAGDRVVLLEEFTGKGCTNCPKGSREIENLLSLYSENLVAVSIHAGFFADPAFFPLGQYDLRTEEGEALFDYLGPNFGYPAGIVNRREFNGYLQHGHTAWAAFIAETLSVPPRVEFDIQHTFDPVSRDLQVAVNGRAKENLDGELRVSVMLVENGIVDSQDDSEAGGIVDDYVHKHVLRGMATAFDGDPVGNGFTTGDTFTDVSAMRVDEEWIVGNCDVIVFVTLISTGSFEVLQAGQSPLQ